ncbi:arginine ABC transporter permease [Bacillus sp. M6-12]|uniref:amino acid ABC transporter permease n=1 Tax=Bacillus sp. M6-12 TaxID=2054166 RepID=UPI000C762C98|nr:amino acid ABC transporter permease [Bacillus sp. M6-12]PLS18152.1 arginine ABC transporter permease [Bacillus sp. M6-12]
MDLNFDQIAPSIPYILQGLFVTLQYTLLSAILGFFWGIVLALFKISNVKLLKVFAVIYTSIFRGLPLILSLALVYFALPQLTGYDITMLEAGVLTFGLNSAAYVSETIRGGILGVDKGQREAALSLGVSYRQLMIDIILPQALKNILPAMVNEGIALLKDSALVSTIGALDLLRRANIIGASKFLYFEPLIIVAIVYYLMVMGMTFAARGLERRLRRSD